MEKMDMRGLSAVHLRSYGVGLRGRRHVRYGGDERCWNVAAKLS